MTPASIKTLLLTLALLSGSWAWGKDPQAWFIYEPDGQKPTLISLDTMKRLAEQGDTHAQVRLGYIYGDAYRVPQDQRESVKWYRMAAEQGHWEGMNALAFKYFEGEGAPVDYVLSYMWFNLPRLSHRLPTRKILGLGETLSPSS